MTNDERAREWMTPRFNSNTAYFEPDVKSLATEFEQVRAEGENAGLEKAALQLVEDVEINEQSWRERPHFSAHHLAEVKWGAAKALFKRWEAKKCPAERIRAAKSPVAQGEAINALPMGSGEQK